MEINLQGLDLKEVLNDIYIGSYINRSKLEVYSKAIPRFLGANKGQILNFIYLNIVLDIFYKNYKGIFK